MPHSPAPTVPARRARLSRCNAILAVQRNPDALSAALDGTAWLLVSRGTGEVYGKHGFTTRSAAHAWAQRHTERARREAEKIFAPKEAHHG